MGERQQEQEIIQHIIHEHPLRRIPNITEVTPKSYGCYGCWRDFLPGDVGFDCSINCGEDTSVHEECAKMGREIRHPVHPSHPLTQKIKRNVEFARNARCSVCDFPWDEMGWLVYICSQGCELFIHLGCAGGLLPADDQVMNHPSHPQHPLRFISITCHFKCNACGTSENGSSYICRICNYWIHESCATLLTPTLFHHHHHHHLSLSFTLPVEYVMYNYACGICGRSLRLTNWVYHCKLCRYVVHIKCATSTTTSNSIENEYAVDEEHRQILKGPVNDIYEELIRPFIERKRGEMLIPQKDNEIFSSYKFHNHHHPLNFILFSSLPSSYDNKNEEDEDDDDNKGESSTLTCDGCTEPIHQKKHNPSTSFSSHSYESGYMSCGKCKYFLHLACFNLPQQLTSCPSHKIKDHHLELQTIESMHNWLVCYICDLQTNGLFYACTKCDFKIDIKCISLPSTIKHAAHLHSDLKRVIIGDREYMYCHVGQHPSFGGLFYRCDKCKSCVCVRCVLLPARNKHRLENHILPLTFNASVNHPDEFYCASCEVQMNPKSRMYHCQCCDQSFHPECIPATSGRLRNFNFGKKLYNVSRHPQHPLRFQVIFKKSRCDLCHDEAYNDLGYQCTSCNFVMCGTHRGNIKLIV